MMSEKLYEIKQNSDGKYWLFNNDRNSCLMISENIASLLDICTVLNEQSDTIQGLLLDRNRQEEKLDIARRNLSKQLEKIDEQQALISALKKENKQLKAENNTPLPYVENSMRRLRAEHKVDEQQALISALKEENEQLRMKLKRR